MQDLKAELKKEQKLKAEYANEIDLPDLNPLWVNIIMFRIEKKLDDTIKQRNLLKQKVEQNQNESEKAQKDKEEALALNEEVEKQLQEAKQELEKSAYLIVIL